MSQDGSPPLSQYVNGFQIGFGIAYPLCFLATLLRIGYRHRRHQIWWDDFWVAIALVFMVFTALVSFISIDLEKDVILIALVHWTMTLGQPLAVWASRLSIQATVIYFLPPGLFRTVSKGAMVGLFLGWLSTTIARIFYSGYPITLIPAAPFNLAPTIVIFIFDILAALWLVGWSSYLLCNMKLKPSLRRLFIASFSAALLLLAINVFRFVVLLTKLNRILFLTSHLELLFSIIAANTLILAAYCYRVMRPVSGDGRSNDTESSTSGSHPEGCTTTRFVTIHGLVTDGSRSNQAPTASTFSSEVGPLTTINTSCHNWANSSQFGRTTGQSTVSRSGHKTP